MSIKLMNASGCHCTTLKELLELSRQPLCSTIVSKSCTLYPRCGNSHPRYYNNENVSINSTGLANEGFFFYLSMVPIFEKIKKKYIISIADLENLDKIIIMLNNYSQHMNFEINIEINLSCPNIIGKGQVGYNFAEVAKLLKKVFAKVNLDNINVGLKLPPYFDVDHFNKMSKILRKFPLSHITCINSLGNGFVFKDNFQKAIVPNGGYGGIGGAVIKPIALANARRFRLLLKDTDIEVIGCGGVVDGRDVLEYKICGINTVQIGTELYKYGPSIFNNLDREYKYELTQYKVQYGDHLV